MTCTDNFWNIALKSSRYRKKFRKRFRKGKVYPCIGMDVEESGKNLHVRVNLGSSEHPFMYKQD